MNNYVCPICWSKNNIHKFFWFDYDNNKRDKIYEIRQCHDCGLEYVYPLPTKEEQLLFYPDYYYSKHLKEGKKSLKDKCLSLEWYLFSIFSNKNFNLPKEPWMWKSFLDIWCWDGNNLEIMKKRWYYVDWFEIWEKYAYKNNIYNWQSILDVEFHKKYDIIRCNHVFEHVDNPSEFLEKVKFLLKDDWIFILNLPNVKNVSSYMLWVYATDRDVPRHIFWYNYLNIQRLLKKHWFNIVKKHKWRQQWTATSIAWLLIWKYNKDIRWSFLHMLIWIILIPIEIFLSIIKCTNTMWFVLKKQQ